MRPGSRLLAASLGVAASALVSALVSAGSTVANPLGLFYDDSFTHFEDYEHPTAMLIAGNCNRDDPRFQQARTAGAEVLAYINPTAVYDSLPCKNKPGLYGRDRERVPLWPYPQYGERVSWRHTHMTDMRAGSAWSNHVVDFVEHLMREGKFDGVFLDVVGARVWADTTEWKEWPQTERDEYTRGNIDLVRRIDAKRRAINPDFIVVNNSLWDRGDALGFEGEKYVDGVVLEHPPLNDYHRKYAGRTFGDSGHRRVLVIARNADDARAWAHVPGVTHVTDERNYGHPDEPLVPFTALRDRRSDSQH
jgi:hypothetical protein